MSTGKVVSIGARRRNPLSATKKRQIQKSRDERKRLFCDVVERLGDYKLKDVANESGVSYTTLFNWCYGATVSPILRTILDVCDAINYKVVLIDTDTVQKSERALIRKSEREDLKRRQQAEG